MVSDGPRIDAHVHDTGITVHPHAVESDDGQLAEVLTSLIGRDPGPEEGRPMHVLAGRFRDVFGDAFRADRIVEAPKPEGAIP